MSYIRVITDYAYTIPTEVGGQNKDTAADVTEWAARGFFAEDDQTHPKFDPLNKPSVIVPDQWYCNFDQLFNWCDQGQDIEHYLAYHELADVTKVVPQAYRDATGDEDPLTWETWGVVGASHAPIQIGGFWYRSTRYGVAGTMLLASTWYDLTRNPNTNQTGIQRMITVDEFNEISAGATP